MTALLVAGAGAGGVLARYGLNLLLGVGALPWTTVGINLAGSFALGAVIGAGPSEQARLVVGLGFLGGFTTFSTFSLDLWLDLDAGRPGRALAVLAVSVLGGVAAAAAGYLMTRS